MHSPYFVFTHFCSGDVYKSSPKKKSQDTAEEWIVSLIREGSLHARIDPDKRTVFFPKEDDDVYEQIINKTQNMSFRLFLLQANANTLLKKVDAQQAMAFSSEISKHLGS